MKLIPFRLTAKTLMVAGVFTVGAPVVGLTLARYGIISPPELRFNALPRSPDGIRAAPSAAGVSEKWEALEDGERAEALAAAVVGALAPTTITKRDWKYYVLKRGTGFGSSGTVLASEQRGSTSNGSAVDSWALWIEIEQLSQGDALGTVMRSQVGSHTKESIATFRAVLKDGRWEVDLQHTQR